MSVMRYRLSRFQGKGQTQRFENFWRHNSTKIDRVLHKTVHTIGCSVARTSYMIEQNQNSNQILDFSGKICKYCIFHCAEER